MEIVIVILISLLIISNIYLIIKLNKKNNSKENLDIVERMGKLELNVMKEITSFKESINDKLDLKLDEINSKVTERINENFEKTNKTFTNVLERLTKIDEAQKKIDNLSVDIVSLENILTDKKTRGIFGEVNLYNILKNIFGDENDLIYKMQYHLSNGTIADSVIFAPLL